MLIHSGRERQLRRALSSYADAMLAKLPAEAELAAQYTFSPEFELRMERLILRSRQEAGLPPARPAAAVASEARAATASDATDQIAPIVPVAPVAPVAAIAQKRPDIQFTDGQTLPRVPRRGKRLLVAAIILAILVSTFGIVAAREPIARFFVSVYEKFSRIVFNTPDTTDVPGAPGTQASNSVDKVDRIPRYLPQGYQEINRVEYDGFLQIDYGNQDNEILYFERQLATTVAMHVDTEKTPVERIFVGGREAMLYSKKGLLNLVWQDNEYAYLISGKFTKEIALLIANSTK